MTYAICFDFPEMNYPWFAAFLHDGFAWTSSLADAAKFETETEAERVLENGYGNHSRRYGVVVEVGRVTDRAGEPKAPGTNGGTGVSLAESPVLEPASPAAPYTGLLDVRTGELLPATVANAARVLHSARAMKAQLNEIVRETTEFLVYESTIQGTQTLHDGNETITLTGGLTVDYDPLVLMDELAVAGCPSDRIDQAVYAVVTHKIDRAVLRQLAAANPDYKQAIERAAFEVEKDYRASVKLRRRSDETQ